MKFITYNLITLLLLISCNNENIQEESISKNALIGDWKGHEYFWTSIGNEESGNGFTGWDYIITSDTIYSITYPHIFNNASRVNITPDSISFIERNQIRKYAWSVNDTLLSLVGILNSEYGKERDSLTFIRSNFSQTIVAELMKYGFNRETLEANKWSFNKVQTIKYLWEEFDSTIYSPPNVLSFSENSNYFVRKEWVIYQEDTFRIWILDEHSLLIDMVIDSDTISLNYGPIYE